jgi:RNA polymerase sigma-70 factor, ECF subfamily
MNGSVAVFESHRSRLFAVACRMLGSRTDAEDLMQDAYLRWHQSATDDIRCAEAYLVTVTKCLCLDRLRQLKREREQYVITGLLESAFDELDPSPDVQRELTDELSVACLMILERLGPEERAAFLLHEVFDYDYPEVAQVLGKAEAACRQIVHRARRRVRESRRRFSVSPESRACIMRKFLAAVVSGDRTAVIALLAEQIECVPDGGGQSLPH